MKKLISLLFSLCIFANVASACEPVKCYYATACTIKFDLHITDATTGAKFMKTAVHAAGDTYFLTAASTTTNGFTDTGTGYQIVLTAGETTVASTKLEVEDQTAPQAWADKCLVIYTIARTSADNGSAWFNFPGVDVQSISGDLTAPDALEAMLDGTGADLSLTHLSILDPTGDAVNILTAGGNGDGIEILANGTGSGIRTVAGATGLGGFAAVGGATSGNAISATNTSGTVVNFTSSGGNGHGLRLDGNGTGAAAALFAGATGDALRLNAGATSGDAIKTVIVSGDGFDGTINGNITGNLSGSIGSFGAGSIIASSFGAGAIDASAIAPNAIGASELAADAGTELGTASWAAATRQLTGVQVFDNTGDIVGNLSGSVGSVVGGVGGNVTGSIGSLGAGSITNATFAGGAIDAAAVAPNAIGASELDADAATEIATAVGSGITLGAGSITNATFAPGAIDSTAVALDAIGSSELAASAASEIGTAAWATTTRQLTATQVFNTTGNRIGNLSGSVGSVGANGITAASIAPAAITASEAPNLDVAVSSVGGGGGGGATPEELSSGIAQSVTSNGIRIAAIENYGDTVLADNTKVVITSATTGKGQSRCICANSRIDDKLIICGGTWRIIPTGVVGYSIRPQASCNPLKY